MRVVGVIDLRGGVAVHARGGVRGRYAPVRIPGNTGAAGDPGALGRFYADACGVSELYVADLDAIAGQPPQWMTIEAIVRQGCPVWLDGGTTGTGRARESIDRGVARVVVGLETLPAMSALAAISTDIGGQATVFSLDLRNGQPVALQPGDADVLAAEAATAGAGTILVLDLALVGSGSGVDAALVARLRMAVPRVPLAVGGGVRDAGDLAALAAAGADAVLVASALLDGRLQAGDVAHWSSSR